ncbi:MAG TPA: PH domain-containing protein, partial [Candidatus Thermoplasmatota archaeon]|nr:PH domain-containing protein [Candidatus Thermoplasmatota archaeon]
RRAAPAPEAPRADAPPPVPTPAAPPPPVAFDGPRPAYLQQGDTPVWSARPRLVAALGALRSLIGILPFLLFSNFMEGPRRVLIPLAAMGIVLMFVAIRFMQLRRTEYVATERRVYARSGLVGTTVSQLTYDKITDITFHQDLLGRLLGYGSVTLQTAGSNQAPITMIGLAEPLAAKETVERWRDTVVAQR